jgi:hypothetical protein
MSLAKGFKSDSAGNLERVFKCDAIGLIILSPFAIGLIILLPFSSHLTQKCYFLTPTPLSHESYPISIELFSTLGQSYATLKGKNEINTNRK